MSVPFMQASRIAKVVVADRDLAAKCEAYHTNPTIRAYLQPIIKEVRRQAGEVLGSDDIILIRHEQTHEGTEIWYQLRNP
jgi:hypothetical protein